MRLIPKAILLFIVCAVLSGCATGRIADLRDCGSLSVGVGLGLGVQARIGGLSHPSVGLMSNGPRIGFENRHLAGAWHELEGFAPLLVPMVFNAGPIDPVGSAANLSYSRICDNYVVGSADTFRMGQWINCTGVDDPSSSIIKRATDFEVGASLLVVSGRVGVNPLEIIDFLLGFVGLDIANDDPESKKEE